MIVLRKNNYIFIITEYSIKVHAYKSNLHQTIICNCIRVTSFRNFYNVVNEILNSKKRQYDNFTDIISLAQQYHMNIEGSCYKVDNELLKVKKHEVTVC